MTALRYHIFSLCALACINATAVNADADSADISRTLSEVVVTGTRAHTDIRHLPVTVSVLSRRDLTHDNRTSILPTVTAWVPGVFNTARGVLGYGVSGGGSGGISVRGLGSGEGRMMVLVDGHPQYSGIYGHSIADSYQTMMADRVEVLRGPASVIYGSNAMGGVINIVTRGMHHDGTNLSANIAGGSYGTFISEVSGNIRRGAFSGNIAAQYNRSDNHRPDMGFEQYGGHLNLAYRFNKHWRAFADGDVTHFNASHPGTVSEPMAEADQWITRGVVNAGIENSFGSTSGALTVYSNFGRHKLNDGYIIATGSPQQRLFRSSDALTGVSLHQSASLFAGNRITLGADYQHIYGHAYYTSRATGEVLDTPNKQSGKEHMHEVAGYALVHQDLNSFLTIDAGLRYDWHSVAGAEWIPQGGIVLRPNPKAEIKATVGKGFRNPTMREMYLYPPSNEDLHPERIVSYELAWTHRPGSGRFQYGANVFYITGDNLIQTVDRRNVNTGKVENWGIEAEASWTISPSWHLSTNHSWLHMVHPLLAAPQYKGYIAMQYIHKKLSVNLSIQQITGLYTVLGSKGRQENFTLVGLSADYRLSPAVSLWTRADNLLAQRYEIIAGYPMPRATFMGGIKININTL